MTEQIIKSLTFALAIDGKEIKSRSPMAVGKAAGPEHPLGERTRKE